MSKSRLIAILGGLLIAASCSSPNPSSDTDSASDSDSEAIFAPTHPVSTTPKDGAIGVPLDQVVAVQFNDFLDGRTVSTSRLHLRSGPVEKWLMAVYNPITKSLLAWPSAPMRKGAVFDFVVGDGLLDWQGRKVAGGRMIRFITGDETAGVPAFQERRYADGIESLFKKRCGRCHGTANGAAMAGLDLSGADGLAQTALNQASGVAAGWSLVKPYRPGQSYLVYKLFDNPLRRGATMPRSLDGSAVTPLTSAEQQMVVDWISNGAFF